MLVLDFAASALSALQKLVVNAVFDNRSFHVLEAFIFLH